MSELILKFNIPEESNEADIAVNAHKILNVIYDFKEELRNKIKHGNYSDKEYKLLEELNEKFYTLINENGIDKLLS